MDRLPLVLLIAAPSLFIVCFTFLVFYMLRIHARERADMLDRIMFANDQHAVEYKRMKLHEEDVKRHLVHKKIKKDAVNHYGQDEIVTMTEVQKDPRLFKKVVEQLNSNQQ